VWTAATALFFMLLYVGGKIALHFLPTGLDPFRNTISDYVRTDFGVLSRAAGLANGTGMVFLLLAIEGSRGLAGISGAIPEMGVLALSRLALPFFPTDLTGSPRTATGAVHAVLAGVSFVAAAFAAQALAAHLTVLGARGSPGAVLSTLSGASFPLLILFALTLLIRPARRILGLVERLFLADLAALFIMLASLLAMR